LRQAHDHRLHHFAFLTRPRGIASLTETTMVSPTEAYFRFEPPSTLMHMTRRAPELSATSRLVCIWIIVLTCYQSPVDAAPMVRPDWPRHLFYSLAAAAVSMTTQRLFFDIGFDSSIATTSPTLCL